MALRWIVGEHRSTVIWPSLAAVEAIHGHGGKTRIERGTPSDAAEVWDGVIRRALLDEADRLDQHINRITAERDKARADAKRMEQQ